MEPETLKYLLLLFLTEAVFLLSGRKTVEKELAETEDSTGIRKGRIIWTVLSTVGFFGIIIFRVLFKNVLISRLLFLFYVFQYSSLIALVDVFSHNYYLEMLPGLLLFVPIGWFTRGFTDAMCGLLSGLCIGFIMALTEYLFFRKLTYGGGDMVYGAAASALIGFGSVTAYWLIFCLVIITAAAVHIFYIRIIRKQNLKENRMAPLLPWFALLTTGFYAFLIIRF